VADRIRWLEGDLIAVAEHGAALEEFRPEACIHLAWYAEPGKYLHSLENIPSLVGSLNMLEELIRVGCRQFVMVGTCAEYDTDAGYLREEGRTDPKTIYAASKLALDVIAQNIGRTVGVNVAWARLFYIYGPYEDERRVVPALILSLLRSQPFDATKGEQVRDYLHVADVASALWALAENGVTGAVNVSSGVPTTVRSMMETVGEIVRRADLIRFGALPYRDWEPMFICGDNRRLIESTGWVPRCGLKEGLRETVNWWRERLGIH
jgi:nucleoside-diphosphate-sugar epimerase